MTSPGQVPDVHRRAPAKAALRRCAGFAVGLIGAVLASRGPAQGADVGSISSQADSSDPRNISGVWWAPAYTHALLPTSGEPIPFTSQGSAAYGKIQSDLKSGKQLDNAKHLCLPQGTPRVMTTAYPFLIVQTPGQVSEMFEENRIYRIIALNAKHQDPDLWDPSFMGDAVGHWEGQTLVIDTTNFKTVTFLDDSGLPHSNRLHVVERLSKAGAKNLVDAITISDPVMFAKPWTARLAFVSRPDVQITTDWVCGEAHRDISSVQGAPHR